MPGRYYAVDDSLPTDCPPRRKRGIDAVASGHHIWCFTEGLGLPVGRWLTKFEVFAWQQFEGDLKKAEEHLGKVGYGGGQIPIVPPNTGLG